jgi:hypothetical protein
MRQLVEGLVIPMAAKPEIELVPMDLTLAKLRVKSQEK